MSVKGAAVKRLFFVFINEYSFSFLPQKRETEKARRCV